MDQSRIITPSITKETACQLMFELYSFNVESIENMIGYNDQNFYIKVSSEHKNPNVKHICSDGFVFKITQKNADFDFFESTQRFTHHLLKKGLRVPELIPTIDGKYYSIKNLPIIIRGNGVEKDTTSCGIYLFSFLPGRTMSSTQYTTDLLRQWGRLLGRFHNALEDFHSEEMKQRKHFWMFENIPQLSGYMKGLNEDKFRLVNDVLKKYSEVENKINFAKTGFLHGDFSDNNILSRNINDTIVVDGILDLEHAHYGTYSWDVGLCLSYVSLRCENFDPIDGMVTVLNGYLQLRHLSDDELSLLKMCIAGRLIQSLVMGEFNSKLWPENKYILDTSRTGWLRLKQIWETPSEILLGKWKNAR